MPPTLFDTVCTTNTSPSAPPLSGVLMLNTNLVLNDAFEARLIALVLNTLPPWLSALRVTRSTSRLLASTAVLALPLMLRPAVEEKSE